MITIDFEHVPTSEVQLDLAPYLDEVKSTIIDRFRVSDVKIELTGHMDFSATFESTEDLFKRADLEPELFNVHERWVAVQLRTPVR